MDPASELRTVILENLRSRRWRAGHRIPTERQLGEQYGISRSTVRRVLAGLKEKRLIVQTVGSGTYVSDEVQDALGTLDDTSAMPTASPAELMNARIAFEPAILPLVVANANAADLAYLEECCENGEAARTFEDFEYWDGQLHEAIAAAAHNNFVTSVFRALNQARAQGEWGAMKRRTATPERRAHYQAQHRELVSALKDRDLSRALDCCRAHLAHVRQNMLGE